LVKKKKDGMTQAKSALIEKLIKESKITFAEALILSEKETQPVTEFPLPSFPPLSPWPKYPATPWWEWRPYDIIYSTGTKVHENNQP